jgi:hypothetical protein
MLSRKICSLSALAGMVAASQLAWAAGASSASPGPAEARAEYGPLQSLSYQFGSKFMSGYFVQQASQCLVMLMVIERSDPDQPLPATAARVRLLLDPGQTAGLDSEEGRSLNVTCGERAAKLQVEAGERDALFALQTRPASREVAGAE